MKKLNQLRNIKNKSDFAKLLDIKETLLNYTLYNKSINYPTPYIKFDIPKRRGGIRSIYAPHSRLKSLQKKLSNLLLDCLDELREQENIINRISHGFEREKNIISHASRHKNKKNILNIDLNNFFESFNFGRVRGFFIKNKFFKLDPTIATLIAQIACYDNKLPQGSPCSPVITNLICSSLDFRLNQLAKKHKCTYGRYADDITFSTNMDFFSDDICFYDEYSELQVGKALANIIRKEGLIINKNKVRYLNRHYRQSVTGLTVNKKLAVNINYYKKVRAMCHQLFKNGSYVLFDPSINDYREGTPQELAGYLSFINSIDKKNFKADNDNRNSYILNKREKTYSDFLFYTFFITPTYPTIITEGQTDHYHIKYALQALHDKYPTLISYNQKQKKFNFKVKFLKFTSKNNFFLNLSSGANSVSNFLKESLARYKNYYVPDNSLPVFAIFDNDSAGTGSMTGVESYIKKKNIPYNKIKINNTNVISVYNMYIFCLPHKSLNPSQKTEIEDYYPESLLKIEYKGKKLNLSDRACTPDQYSKSHFAKYVVINHIVPQNFYAFEELLNLMNKLVKKHAPTL